MKWWLLLFILSTTFVSSCLVQKSNELQTQKKEDCDSGEKIIEKIKKKEEPFSLTNTEKGCSLDELGEKKLDL